MILGTVTLIFWNSYSALLRQYQSSSNSTENVSVKQKEQLFTVFAKALDYRNSGRQDQAIKELEKAIAIDPLYVRAYLERSLIYYRQKKWEFARKDTDRVLELDPFESIALYNKGTGYNNDGEQSKALEYLEKTVRYNPQHYSAWLTIGRIYLNQKKYTNAKESLQNAIKIKHGPQAHFFMGTVQYHLQNLDEAIRHYSLSIAFGNKSVVVYRNRGACYSEKKQYVKSIEDMDKVLEMTPQDHTVHNSKGYSYAKLGKFAVAQQSVDTALKIRVTRAALDTKGEILNHRGQYKDALRISQQSLQIGEFGDVYYNRAISYYMLRKYDLARENYLKALKMDKLATEDEYFEDIPNNSKIYPQQQSMKTFFQQVKNQGN